MIKTNKPHRAGCAKALLADDDPINRDLVGVMLDNLGYRVTAVEDGAEALAAWRQSPFDLAVFDCRMPVLDGLAAATGIRRLEAEQGRQPVPIIAMTACNDPSAPQSARAAGMDDCLVKPLLPAQFAGTIARMTRPEMPSHGIPGRSECRAEQPENAGGPTLNHSRLQMIRALQRDDQDDVLWQFVELFLNDAPKLIRAIKAALCAADAKSLWECCHRLKSSASNMGANQITRLAARLEIAAHEQNFEQASTAALALPAALSETRSALLEVVAAGPSLVLCDR